MAQASGKSGHYRYYKCTTRLNKGISRCDSRNLPREQTDALVLDMPQQPGAIPNTETYFDLMDYIVRTLATAFGENK